VLVPKTSTKKLTAYGQEKDTGVFDLSVFAPDQHCAPKDAERRCHEGPEATLSGPLTRVRDAD